MVYADPKNLGYQPYYEKWMKKWTNSKEKEKFEILIETLQDMFNKYIPALIQFIYDGVTEEEVIKPLEFIVYRTDLNLVTQLCKLIDTQVTNPE